MSLLSIFATAILPIVAIAAAGFLLGTIKDVEVGPLNTVTVYVLMPALIFHSLATTDLSGETLLGIGLAVLVFTGVMAGIAELAGRTLGETEPVLGSFVLMSVFPNAGNLGIPVSEFVFGAIGRSTAVMFIVAQAIAMYTLGVYVAARGQGDDWREGAKTIFAIPLVYAVVAALAAKGLGVLPPDDSAAMETVKLVGDSAIPVMLLILGLELARIDYAEAIRRVAPPVTLKLLVAPVVAVGVAMLVGTLVDFGNEAVARVFVLECAMPAAVTPLILTGEFSEPDGDDIAPTAYAGTAIFVTTVLSLPLLTVLIALLEEGLII